MDTRNLKNIQSSKPKTEPNEKQPIVSSKAPTPVEAVPSTAPTFNTDTLTETEPPDETSQPALEIERDPLKTLELEPKIVEQLSTVFDPEIPVNIYELGLIYDVTVDKNSVAVIKMTLTAPGCPAAGTLPAEVQAKTKSVDGVSDARVELVWEPPWSKDRMSEAAKLQLGIFD